MNWGISFFSGYVFCIGLVCAQSTPVDPFEGIFDQPAIEVTGEKEIRLSPESAKITGGGKIEGGGTFKNLGWIGKQTEAVWRLNIKEEGNYLIEGDISSIHGMKGKEFSFTIGGKTERWRGIYTGDWYRFIKVSMCEMYFPKGVHELKFKSYTDNAINVGPLYLTRSGSKIIKIKPDGTTLLKLEDVILDGPRLSKDWGVARINDFMKGNSKIGWDVDARKGNYALEVAYASPKGGNTDVLLLRTEDESYHWHVNRTGSWDFIAHRNVGLIRLPEGKSRFTIQEWSKNPFIDIHSVRLTPLASPDELRKRPRLGMNLAELQSLWGNGTRRVVPDIAKDGGKADKDRKLFELIQKDCEAHIWQFPEEQNLNITAIFWLGRCIGLHISKDGGFSIQDSVELAKELVPDVVFSGLSAMVSPPLTVYSKEEYKLQYWRSHFELKSPELLRKLDKEYREDLKRHAAFAIQKLKTVENGKTSALFGMGWKKMDQYLGASIFLDTRWCGLPSRTWLFKEEGLALVGSFKNDGKVDTCQCITIIDNGKKLTLDIALPIARQLVAPYMLESVPRDKKNSAFTISSTDRNNRFKVEWYNDDYTRRSMRITDTMPNLEHKINDEGRRKNQESSNKASMDSIRELL